MEATKAEVSEAHASSVKKKYANRIRLEHGRRALVVGSDREHNIGAMIADSLVIANEFFEVHEVDKEQVNVSLPSDLEVLDFGRYDTLVLANGATKLRWLEDFSPLETASIIEDTLVGSIFATQEFVRKTIEKPYLKNIVFIGSMAHRAVLNASSPYCAAKAGLAHFARCAGWELTPKGYRVFTVHPSNTEGTPMTEETIRGIEEYRGVDRRTAENYWGAINLMPRWLCPEDIGEVVRWLVTEDAAQFLSGSDIELKAGLR